MSSFYSGLSGIQLPIPQYRFPPPLENASRLTFYATLFNSIEINSSFYKIPQEKTVAKWAKSVPDNFRFTFKLWREITHKKGLEFNEKDIDAFFKSINAVQEKKGCLLLQFPPSLSIINNSKLEKLLKYIKHIDKKQEWKIAVEFRNLTWYNDPIYEMLAQYQTAIVIHDMPKWTTPLLFHSTDFIYYRFHGPSGNYRESYSESFLEEYAKIMKDWIDDGKMVYVYFNNTMGDAFKNLQTLNKSIDI